MSTPFAVTFKSERGIANRCAPSGWTWPCRPSASSTAFHGPVCCAAYEALHTRNKHRTNRRVRFIVLTPHSTFLKEVIQVVQQNGRALDPIHVFFVFCTDRIHDQSQ